MILETDLTPHLTEIKLQLTAFEDVIVRFIQNSRFLNMTAEFLSKMVLKIHQIVMEVSTRFHTSFRNNIVEAHGLYAVLRDLPPHTQLRTFDPEFLDFSISITSGECEIQRKTFYINSDIVFFI